MQTIFRRHVFLPVAALLIYSGCAKQPVTTGDTPLGGHLPTPSLAQSAPVPSQPGPEGRKPLPPESVITETPIKEVTSKSEQVTGLTSPATPLQAALGKIYFDFDSADLSAAARQQLAENYQVLKKNGKVRVRIEGNCDERGSDEYNLALGERRAQAAARYLTSMGIAGSRLSTISYGKEKPADPGHDETAWTKNRRDEFVIIGR